VLSEAYTLGEVAKLWLGNQVRSWLGTWPMSEFPRVFGSGPTSTGISVDEYSILNYAPVYACTAVISGDVGSLPLGLNKIDKEGSKEPFTDHKTFELVHDRPNPEMSSMVFRETLQAHALTWGNGYAEIERDGANRVVALWPITPDRVTLFRDSRRLRYRVTNANGGEVVLDPMNILHVPGMGFDGTVGYSIVSLARESLALGIATERFGSTFFGNGSTFGGGLMFKSKLTKEVKQGIRESIDAVHSGVDRAHKFIILGDDAKYERFGIPPNDAQFLETRRFQIAEVARWFGGIPLHKLGDLERATFSNIEQQDIEYYKSCLRRWLVRWEQELNYKLISPLERRYQRIEFNVEGLLRGDSQARAEFYSKMFNIGVYSINMILEKENQNLIGPEGDVHYVPVNLVAAEFAMEPPQATVTDVTPPALPPADQTNPDDTATQRVLLQAIEARTMAIAERVEAQRDALTLAELEQQRQAVTRLSEERSALQQQLDAARAQHASEAAALQAQLEVANQETRHVRDAAAAESAAVGAQARETEAARAMAEQQWAAEVAARAAADTALQMQRQAETDRLTGMLTAHRALIVDALGRMVRRETEKARRHQATPAKLREWAEAFYLSDEELWVDALRPAIRAHLTWKQSTENVDAVTVSLVKAHYADSQQQLRAVLASDPDEIHGQLERLWTRWEQDRPAALADRILQEEVDHVRSARGI
jgi:HK97 family phage portal protein